MQQPKPNKRDQRWCGRHRQGVDDRSVHAFVDMHAQWHNSQFNNSYTFHAGCNYHT